jgi:hypothetical protein
METARSSARDASTGNLMLEHHAWVQPARSITTVQNCFMPHQGGWSNLPNFSGNVPESHDIQNFSMSILANVSTRAMPAGDLGIDQSEPKSSCRMQIQSILQKFRKFQAQGLYRVIHCQITLK